MSFYTIVNVCASIIGITIVWQQLPIVIIRAVPLWFGACERYNFFKYCYMLCLVLLNYSDKLFGVSFKFFPVTQIPLVFLVTQLKLLWNLTTNSRRGPLEISLRPPQIHSLKIYIYTLRLGLSPTVFAS